MSSLREFAKGASLAIILALVIVSAVHIYLPTEKPFNPSSTITSSVPYHTSSQPGIKGNYLLAYFVTILLATLLSLSAYFILKRNYS